jgi:hypothetical protein
MALHVLLARQLVLYIHLLALGGVGLVACPPLARLVDELLAFQSAEPLHTAPQSVPELVLVLTQCPSLLDERMSRFVVIEE